MAQNPTTLSNAEKKHFRQIAHGLKPVVTLAEKGLIDSIRQEIDGALSRHELIKIKLVMDREQRQILIDNICSEFKAECVQSIGQVAVLYRPAKQPDPRLSNLLRAKQPN